MGVVYFAFAVLVMAAQVYSQYIPPYPAGVCAPSCGCAAPAVIAAPAPTVVMTNPVAANLADTLSLLTVSSLLAETLPYGCPAVVPSYPGCGCGCGCGYGYVL